jgi:transcriptional regulator with XRE-family HTH domain
MDQGADDATEEAGQNDGAAALSRLVGGEIRRLRRQGGLTLADLAERSDLSQPFLSQIERGRAMPSLLALHRIGEALGVNVPTLLGAGLDDPVSLLRASDGTFHQRSDVHGSVLERLLVSGRRMMEPGEVRAIPGADSGDPVQHAGEEMIFVLAGRLTVELEDREPVDLSKGDSLYYPATIPHRWRTSGNREARFLIIATPSTF